MIKFLKKNNGNKPRFPKLNKEYWLLLLIFIITISFQLFFTLQTPNLSNSESYYNIRQVEHISETGKPLYYDTLSYGGRQNITPPLFYYLLVFFNSSPIVLKIIPIILISTLVFIVYGISFHITKNIKASLLSSLIASFIPILYTQTLNKISIHSITLPLFFFMIYCMLKVDESKKYIDYFFVLSFLLPLINPIAFLIPISFAFFIVLTNTEYVGVSSRKKELILFSFLLIFLIEFVIYKEAFLKHGARFIWQNTPPQILDMFFTNVNIFDTILTIGILPAILGFIAVVYTSFKLKKEPYLILSSVLLSLFLLLMLKLITLSLGLTLLGITLTIFSSFSIYKFFLYFSKTKLHKHHKQVLIIFIGLVLLLSFIPSYVNANNITKDSFAEEEIEDIKWIRDNTDKEDVILAPLEYGSLINTIAKRKNVIDDNFLLAPSPEQRLGDVDQVYLTPFETKALEVTDKYNVKYIYFPDRAKQGYQIENIVYVRDGKCFNEIKPRIIKVLC